MNVPTMGEEYAKLMENLRLAQEHSAMIAHLCNANDRQSIAVQWLVVSENFKKLQHAVTKLAMGGLQ